MSFWQQMLHYKTQNKQLTLSYLCTEFVRLIHKLNNNSHNTLTSADLIEMIKLDHICVNLISARYQDDIFLILSSVKIHYNRYYMISDKGHCTNLFFFVQLNMFSTWSESWKCSNWILQWPFSEFRQCNKNSYRVQYACFVNVSLFNTSVETGID